MGALQVGDHVPFMPIFTTADQGESVAAIAGPKSSNNAENTFSKNATTAREQTPVLASPPDSGWY